MNRLIACLLVAFCMSGCAKPATNETPTEATNSAAQHPTPDPIAPASDDAAAATSGQEDGDWRSFGTEFSDDEVVAASKLLQSPATFVGKTVVMEGTVADVCQKAGCWPVVSEGTKTIRIRTKDHGFSVDKDCSGDTARIHGQVIAKDITPEEAAHFASESQKPELAPESGAAETLYEIEATGIKLKRS